jgi:hypothetical protein
LNVGKLGQSGEVRICGAAPDRTLLGFGRAVKAEFVFLGEYERARAGGSRDGSPAHARRTF